MTWLQHPVTRQWGWFVLALAIGFGAGNYHTTDEAIQGSSRWWQAKETKDVKKHLTVQQQADYDACSKVVIQVEADAN